MKRTLAFVLSTGLFFAAYAPACRAETLKVVTSLSTFADLVRQVGGDEVDVSSIASPRFNPHTIEPRPSDVLKLKRADLFVHGGLDLEAWRDPLLNAAGRAEIRAGGDRQLDLGSSVRLLEVPDHQISRAEGDIHLFGNPHYWLSPQNGLIMVDRIAAKLSELAPERSATFRERADTFRAALLKDIEDWQQRAAACRGGEVIGYHNEWVYLLDFLGMTSKEFLEPKPGVPPTPRHLEELRSYAVQHPIRAIIQASYASPEVGEQLGRDTGVPFLILSQSVGEQDSASDYRALLRSDIEALTAVCNHE